MGCKGIFNIWTCLHDVYFKHFWCSHALEVLNFEKPKCSVPDRMEKKYCNIVNFTLPSTDFRDSLKNGNRVDRIAGLTDWGKYERNYLTVYDLMTHTEDMTIEDLYQYSLVSSFPVVVTFIRVTCL